MAEVKLVWYIFNWLGWPSFAYGVIASIWGLTGLGDIQILQLEEPFKTTFIIIGLLFGLVKLFAGYETYREKRIKNNESQYELEMKKKKIPKKHTPLYMSQEESNDTKVQKIIVAIIIICVVTLFYFAIK